MAKKPIDTMCAVCGETIKAGEAFCGNCGAPVSANDNLQQNNLNKKESRTIEQKKAKNKQSGKKGLKVALVIAVLFFSICVVLGVLYLTGVTSDFIPINDISSLFGKTESISAVSSTESETTTLAEITTVASQTYNTESDANELPQLTAKSTQAASPSFSPSALGLDVVPVNEYYTVTTSGSDLNLRSEPNTDSDVLKKMPNETSVYVEYSYYNWAYLKYDNTYGWASLDYLS